MFKALFIKEWAQLRALRWVGFGLGVLLPVFLLAGAEGARQGWFAEGIGSDYSVRTVFVSAMPQFLVAIWGLLGLLIAAQVYAGDRAAGVESFLLERPVPRCRVWEARLVASALALIVIVLGNLAVWAAMAQIAASPTAGEWADALGLLGGLGLIASTLGLLGGVAGAALVNTPIQAVLLGLFLAAVPIGLSGTLAGRFPLAAIGYVPLGLVLPLIVLVGFVVSSHRALCRGEPAGRGRVVRGVVVLALATLAVPLVFAVTAPLAVRFNSTLGTNFYLLAPRDGGSALLLNENYPGSAGWLVDLEAQRKTRFLPPPIHDVAWKDDGSVVAVLHSSGGFGGQRSDRRLDLIDSAGERLPGGMTFDNPADWPAGLVWHGERLLAKVMSRGLRSALLVIDPQAGTLFRIEIDAPVWSWWLHVPSDGEDAFVHLLVDRDADEKQFVLRRLDFEERRLDPSHRVVEFDVPTYAPRALSPSGRYWLRVDRAAESAVRLWDLETTLPLDAAGAVSAGWLADDRLLTVHVNGPDRELRVGSPGGEAAPLRSWKDASLVTRVDPSGRRVLVQVWRPQPGAGGPEMAWTWTQHGGETIEKGMSLAELWLCQPDAAEPCAEVISWFDGPVRSPRALYWAGPHTLALFGPGELAVKDVRNSDRSRHLIGR